MAAGDDPVAQQLRNHVQRRERLTLRTGPSEQRIPIAADVIQQMLVNPPSTGEGLRGQLVLAGAQIVGKLDLAGLNIDGIAAFIDCSFTELINLEGSTVGTLVIQKSSLKRLSGIGLQARSLQLHDVNISSGLALQGARISGDLDLRRCSIHPGPNMDFAAIADRLIVEGNLTLDEANLCGGLGLHGAQVGGTLSMQGASLTARPDHGGRALQAPGIQVGAAFFARRSRVEGIVYMPSAVIRADLDFRDASLIRFKEGQGNSHALQVDNSSIGDDLRFDGSTVEGVSGVGVRAAGSINFDGCNLIAHQDTDALILDYAAIVRSLFFRSGYTACGRIKLTAATIGLLAVDLDSWPKDARVDLTDTTVQAVEPALSPTQRLLSRHEKDDNIDRWIEWLDQHAERFPPNLFEQLAMLCQAAGDETGARKARYRAEVRKTRYERPLRKIWGTFLDVTVGYGYRPVFALGWLLLYAFSGWVFYANNPLTPVKADESLTWDPLLYTVDVLVPLVDLGYGNAYQTSGCAKVAMILLTLVGWFLVAAVVAGVGRIVSRK